MAMREALVALYEHWEDVRARLDAETGAELIELLTVLDAESDDEARNAVARRLIRLVRDHLPPGHPVLAALLRGGEPRFATADLHRLDDLLADLRSRSGPRNTAEAEPDAWLIAAPALSVEEIRARGLDPEDPGLIRLRRDDGPDRLPAFQFGGDGRPRDLVMHINRLLDADEDPWGVADWWLGRNAWLDGIPAALLGHVEDDRLLAAAEAELTEA